MKYNKSEIMKRAHAICRETGKSQSTSLRMAWIEAKIANINDDMFYLKMKDRWDSRDNENDRNMRYRLDLLKEAKSECEKLAA